MKKNAYVCQNDLSSAICDLVDVIDSLPEEVKQSSKDGDDSEFTVNDCLHDIMLFLESLKSQVYVN